MDIGTMGVVIRVVVCCIVFAYFLFAPLKSRLRFTYLETSALVSVFIALTVVITIMFLIPERRWSHYSLIGVVLWIFTALLMFHFAIKGSYLEIAFTVLVILNLYVNIVAVAKVIANSLGIDFSADLEGAFITVGVLAAYMPFLSILFCRLYKEVIEINIKFSFWKFLWVVPALTYTIFYVKIINDYWRNPAPPRVEDVVFIVLWSFTTYVFFMVTLQMLIQAYHGIAATEQVKLARIQLSMQERESRRLFDGLERTARLRHDWRHHLLTIHAITGAGDLDRLTGYLNSLLPEYVESSEESVCQNHVVDLIIRYFVSIAKEEQIAVQAEMGIPSELSVSDTDLCIIFANLLENAVEACKAQEKGERHIEIKSHMQGTQLITMIQNTYAGVILRKGEQFKSTRHEGEGIGLSSVKKVVEKYNGKMKVAYDHKNFSVFFILNPCQGTKESLS